MALTEITVTAISTGINPDYGLSHNMIFPMKKSLVYFSPYGLQLYWKLNQCSYPAVLILSIAHTDYIS